MTIDQICESIETTARLLTTDKLMYHHEKAEQRLKQMHELAWQLVEATRSEDDEE